jgi:peptide/nickel transport system ATP-binding protein
VNHSGSAVLELNDVRKSFVTRRSLLGRPRQTLVAVDGVTLDVRAGEAVGLVGESGSGKSTLARLALRLLRCDSGSVRFGSTDITDLPERTLRPLRREMQMIFQDPLASLDPSMTVGGSIAEPLQVHEGLARPRRRERVEELLGSVGLDGSIADRYPSELSGGQRQRVSIARAIAQRPQLIVCDEAVSALDLSTQAQVLNLLDRLRREIDVAYLFVSHDLQVVHHVSDRDRCDVHGQDRGVRSG